MKATGRVFKYGDNVDTDVIIPARYLNSSDPAELATHRMEDIDGISIENTCKCLSNNTAYTSCFDCDRCMLSG